MPRNHRTLVLVAHPSLSTSRVNSALADAVRDLEGVRVRDLASVRDDSGFHVGEEQRMLIEHDTVVLQFPWYWCSVPGILKEWMDQVLNYGSAYGSAGTQLHSKSLQVVDAALTTYGARYRTLLADEHLRATA